MKKTFHLTVVRHGEACHNVPYSELQESQFKFEEDRKIVDSDLTEKGQIQANLVGARLKDEIFDAAITSDLKRAVQTAEAIIKQTSSIKKLDFWKSLRERYMGDLEGNLNLYLSLIYRSVNQVTMSYLHHYFNLHVCPSSIHLLLHFRVSSHS